MTLENDNPSQTVDGRNHNDGDTIERRACPGARHRNPASSCRREFVRQPDSLEKVHAWNQLPFMEPASVHGTSFRSWNQLPFMEPASVHGTSFRSWNQLPFMEPASVHGTSFRSWNQLPFMEPASVHGTSFRSWNQLPFSENCPNPHARLWMFMRCSPTLIGAIAATRSRTATATTCKEGRNGKACNCSVVGAATWSSDATTAARPSTSTRRETFPPRWRVAPALVELLLNSANRSQTVTASSRLEYR